MAEIMFERVWVMPNRYTFSMAPVRELLEREVKFEQRWADPFAGRFSPATDTNDIAVDAKAQSHEDALEWLRHQPTEGYDGVLFDPPYSYIQAIRAYATSWEGYKGHHGTIAYMNYIFDCKDEIARIVKPGGHAICFGYNSSGVGEVRGFKLYGGMVLAHGQSHDTIITLEIKL